MKKTVLFIMVASAILLSGNVYSQNNFSIHAGPSFPISVFGDDDMGDDDSGLAGTGINVGVDYVYSLSDKGLGLFLGADFMYNGLKSDVRDDLEDELEDEYDNPDVNFYEFINIPVMGGLNYNFKANDQVSLFGAFGIGVDFLKVTNMTIEVDDEEVESSFDLSTQLAFKVGGGIIIRDKFILGLNYYGLGKHNIEGEIEYNNDTENLEDAEKKVTVMTVTFGIKI